MKEDIFNTSVRKFLKKIGITSQREIEKHVDEAIRLGNIQGNETFRARVFLEIPDLGIKTDIEGEISLE